MSELIHLRLTNFQTICKRILIIQPQNSFYSGEKVKLSRTILIIRSLLLFYCPLCLTTVVLVTDIVLQTVDFSIVFTREILEFHREQ